MENNSFNNPGEASQKDTPNFEFKTPNRKPRPKKKGIIFKVVISILLAVSLGCNGYLLYVVNSGKVSTDTTVEDVDYDINSSLSDIIDQVEESVVGVVVYSDADMTTEYSTGSGVVFEVDGDTSYIITNNHVIEDGEAVQVVFSNGEYVDATVVGSDTYSDIAVLKITTDFDVNAIDIGDSDLLDTGDTVLAIGAPLGIEYAGTVTEGIVSATNRTVSVDLNEDGTDDWDMTVIQTDAAINPGNSGGALVNAAGELVGITSMKYSDTDVEGMGFALPINDVMETVNEIMETGSVTHPQLGISGVSLSDYSSWQLENSGIDLTEGVYVTKVKSGSAAENAGIEEGDVIVEFDGTEIDSYKTFLEALYAKEPGDTVKIVINRDGTEKTLSVTLGSTES